MQTALTLLGFHLKATQPQEKSMSHTSSSDEMLVKNALRGSEDSFMCLVAKYQSVLSQLLWRFTRDSNTVEDLLQETFIDAFNSLARFDTSKPLLPWLRTIAVRKAYAHIRQIGRAKTVSLEELQNSIPADDASTDVNESAEFAHKLLSLLPERERVLLTLIYLEELSMKEVAEALSWSLSKTKTYAHRARKAMVKKAEVLMGADKELV